MSEAGFVYREYTETMVTVSEAALVGLLVVLAITAIAIRYANKLRASPDATSRERKMIYLVYVVGAIAALGLVTEM